MEKQEFNLSNKIYDSRYTYDSLFVPDVKEFIKLLKEGCSTFISAGAVCSTIDRLAGDKLI